MDLSWLEAAGRFTLSFYLFVMAGLLMATVVHAALGSSRLGTTFRFRASAIRASSTGDASAPASRVESSTFDLVSRLFFEYVGNVSFGEDEDPDRRAAPMDRRENPQARLLLDWLKEQMEERGFPARDGQRFLEDMREAVRQEERMASGARATEVFEDPPPG